MPERLYSTFQVATLLGATLGTVMEWMQKGWLPFKRLPDGSVRVPGSGLVRFLKERGVNIEQIMAKALATEGEYQPRNPAEGLAPVELTAVQPSAVNDRLAPDVGAPEGRGAAEPLSPSGAAEAASSSGVAADPASSSGVAADPALRQHVAEAVSAYRQEVQQMSEQEKVAAHEQGRQQEPVAQPAGDPVQAPATGDPAAQVAQAILQDAIARGASDIHLDSAAEGLALRLRIDGVLQDKTSFKARLPQNLAPQIIAHFKAQAALDVQRTRQAQQGLFAFTADGRQVKLRLSAWPTIHGEKLTISLRAAVVLPGLSQLGLDAQDEARLRALLVEGAGLILLAGPPRCGKDVTLRAMAAELNTRERAVATIERSVDAEIPGVNQSAVDAPSGFGFAEAMRALADADGDVILIDDIPDPATALAAFDAAQSGKLVLGGMNVRSAPAAAATLLEMGLAPWPLSSALLMVVEQRNVRRLCESCRKQAAASDELLGRLGLNRRDVDFPAFAPGGCAKCNSGYSGLTRLLSVTYTEGPVAKVLRASGNVEAIRQAAQYAGTRPLGQVGLEKVRAGLTSLDELARVLPSGAFRSP